eukprot:Hpha_TRINITY_DN16658_c3_g3::TRINITY_DN16658_c3_g3_i1::g.183461::m.183461/K12375/ARSI_J; arylsulfatase I/J
MLPALAAAVVAAVKPPHLILMALDDVGWADVSMRGGAFRTPRIDGLVQEGLLVDKFYTQPVCSPTRSSFITGRYPFHTGMQHTDTLVPGTTAHIPQDTPTIAELLRDKGYETHAVGKWHLGYSTFAQTPVGRGFGSFTGYLQGKVDYYDHTIGAGDIVGMDFWDNTTGELRAMWELKGQYTMPHYKQRVEQIIDNLAPGKSLFLYYAHQEIHNPIEYPPDPKYAQACAAVPKDFPSAEINRQALCAMMNDLDEAVGDFADLLKSKGMWEDTLVWVASDNGGMTHWENKSPPASASSNWPLRGSKTSLFEGGLRVTSWLMGGFLPASAKGTTYHGLLHAVDIVPTLTARAGVAPLANWDGKDVWGALTGGEAADTEREIPLNVYDEGKNFSALLRGEMKVINGYAGNGEGYWTAGPEYAFIPPPENSTLRLFNLTADPTEKNNLADSMPDLAQELVQRLLWHGQKTNGYLPPQPNTPNLRALPSFHNGTWAPFESRF